MKCNGLEQEELIATVFLARALALRKYLKSSDDEKASEIVASSLLLLIPWTNGT